MRKNALILCILLLITTNAAVHAQENDELTDLTSAVTTNGLEVADWRVTVKENMNRDEINQVLDKLRKKTSYFGSSSTDENTIEYKFEYANSEPGMTETYQIMIPKDNKYQPELIAVIKGKEWNRSMKETYLSRMNNAQDDFFTNDSTTFACLTSVINGKIDDAYFINKLTETLQLSHMQEQTDSVENSAFKKIVYGYTPLWDQRIQMEEPVNLQMVFKESTHGNTRLTIGTPILITEY